jgi:HD-GYP domain-containing protein (c-di-GMP phosphodiesterase class II)
MTSERSYKKTTEEKAVEELKKFAAIHFDPELIEKFVRLLSKKTICS